MQRRELTRILRNWRDERDSAALYGALAAFVPNPRLSRVFARLAEGERRHAAYWEQRLHEGGQTVPRFRPSLRARLMMQLARQFGVSFVVPRITARELADHERYSTQADARAAGLSAEERDHAAVMRRIAAHGGDPKESEAGESTGSGGVGTVGNNLRAAVLGANDGLASNFCLLMGVAGGAMPTAAIVLTGVAGLVAGACSMALGEWLSVTNAREMSRVIAVAGRGHNAASAAAYSFALFALGASVPLLPFLLASGGRAIVSSIALSLVALFGVGLVTSLFNGRSPIFSGVRQVVVGAAAAAVTYAAGRVVGAAIG